MYRPAQLDTSSRMLFRSLLLHAANTVSPVGGAFDLNDKDPELHDKTWDKFRDGTPD